MKSNVVLFNPNNIDSMMAAFVVFKNTAAKLIPWKLGQNELPGLTTDQRSGKVYLVGVSPPINILKELMEYMEKGRIVWIDHHLKSAVSIESLKIAFPELYFDRMYSIFSYNKNESEERISSSYLAYTYFNSSNPVPLGIKLISLEETGQYKKDKKAIPFYIGIKQIYHGYLFNDVFKDIYYGELDIKSVVDIGRRMLKNKRKEVFFDEVPEYNPEFYSVQDTEFDGIKAKAINSSVLLNVNIIELKKGEIIIRYHRQDGKWIIHLHSGIGDVDVNMIAQKYGGWGHQNEACFHSIGSIPFKI